MLVRVNYSCIQCRIKLPGDDVLVENLFPVKVYGRLAITNESDALLHKCADVEVVSIASARRMGMSDGAFY